jgi:glycosyltransferase involved in cell wall biosynthesis
MWAATPPSSGCRFSSGRTRGRSSGSAGRCRSSSSAATPGEWEGQHPLATARALGNDQVFLAGWRPHGVLPQALNAADLLVLPSVAEACGLVLVEAMSCGLPVIAAEAHGPAEIVAAGTGWLVPSDDEDALADALVTAASDAEERRRRGPAPTATAILTTAGQ